MLRTKPNNKKKGKASEPPIIVVVGISPSIPPFSPLVSPDERPRPAHYHGGNSAKVLFVLCTYIYICVYGRMNIWVHVYIHIHTRVPPSPLRLPPPSRA